MTIENVYDILLGGALGTGTIEALRWWRVRRYKPVAREAPVPTPVEEFRIDGAAEPIPCAWCREPVRDFSHFSNGLDLCPVCRVS